MLKQKMLKQTLLNFISLVATEKFCVTEIIFLHFLTEISYMSDILK